METANLRAAREAFRERNPLIRVGHTDDGVSVLKVIFSPFLNHQNPHPHRIYLQSMKEEACVVD